MTEGGKLDSLLPADGEAKCPAEGVLEIHLDEERTVGPGVCAG